MKERHIPFSKPYITELEYEYVSEVLKSGWLSRGPKTKFFEEKMAKWLGVKHAIGVNSCTAALHLALLAYEIGEGDEVITSPYTFCSSANVIVHVGAKPVFVDIREDFNMNSDLIEDAITDKTKAIIPVHFGGSVCEMDKVMAIADKHNLIVIEDTAHGLGAKYKNQYAGTFGHVGAFSFYATKNLTTGEGGLFVTNDDRIADKARVLSLHGMSQNAWNRYEKGGSWQYEVHAPGYKYNMTDIQAALGTAQLEKFDEMQTKRKEIVNWYSKALESYTHAIHLQYEIEKVHHAWHLYPIVLKNEEHNRAEVVKALNKSGVGTSVHFIPLHLQPFYQKTFDLKRGDYPVTEKMYDGEISLPLYPSMTFNDVDYVTKQLICILKL